MAARSLFHSGCRWRVGSESFIYAWMDLWLPRPYFFKPITKPLLTSDDWDPMKIEELFCSVGRNVILGIPPNQLGIDDVLVWHYSLSGLFTTRSAYHQACSLADQPGSGDLLASE
ncbi:UNVERIFIED_CONTAM: hypothetical protein Slati_1397800 [Sesamum latifolium]|uniref:Uncharacterized protein n=1 Tax=Sesamum latifolium TaxID=2727402 RepID=A0AAW2X2Q2_9LAMI